MRSATVKLSARGLAFVADVAGPRDGELVLLLHGFPHSRATWRHQMAPLARAGFQVVAPDQRGYSPEARPKLVEDYAADELVGDVLALADSLGAERFHLVGHDWGGQIAWLTAAAWPERLRTLTVLSRPHPAAFAAALADGGAQASMSRHHAALQDPATAERLLADGQRRLRAALRFECAAAMFDDDALAKAEASGAQRLERKIVDLYLQTLGDPCALDAALNWYRAGFQGASALAVAAPAVSTPTLFLWGSDDRGVSAAAVRRTAEFVSGPYRQVTLEAGHFLPDTASPAVNAHLLAHLLGISP